MLAIFDPLEQFEVFPLLGFSPLSSLTNLTVIEIFNFILIGFIFLCILYPNQSQTVPTSTWSFVGRSVFDLIKNVSKSNIRLEKQVYFPFLLFLFLLVLVSNVVGLIPFSYTVTSSFAYTLFLSLSIFITLVLISVWQHGYKSFAFAQPEGSPLALLPLISLVELVSYLSRIFSLSIRLFANMMAGHTLLKILIGFSWAMLNTKGAFVICSLLPWTVVTLVMCLEYLIAVLQAYVFVVLVSLYINDVILMH